MLRELDIRNFVLIDHLRLELDKALNVLTGETGAGKSIVLDALGLLVGERFASESVRQGTESSEISGLFDAPTTREFKRWWEDHGWVASSEILIRREGDSEGRSRAFLNDRPVTLATLEELGHFLVDVHGQNEHQQILKPAVQLASLDRFAGLQEACAQVAPLFAAWQKTTNDLRTADLSEQERLQRLDLIQYQLQEIESARLKAGEEDELAVRLPELKNAGRLREQAATAYGALYGDDGSALERLGVVERALLALKELAPSAEPVLQTLQEARSHLEEAAHELKNLAERWETEDPQALEALLGRLDLLSRLKKKYAGSVEEILNRAQGLRTELDRLENADQYRRDLEKQNEEARRSLDKAAENLSQRRRKAAQELSRPVQSELADLGLKQALFRVRVEQETPTAENPRRYFSTGIDQVIFEWAPNPGEGIQPLKEIASGGEMSRVMLALKTVLAQTDDIPVLVFDEVDAGIGGLTAQAVGRKLRALARHHQILCVSHLPQIASCAHAHFQVVKTVHKARTRADVTRLKPDERLEELARLLGSQVTPTSVQHAKEMLAKNQ